MREAVETEGRTVEEAIDAALDLLGATDDEVEIKVLAEGGTWRGNEIAPARVRVGFRDELSPQERAEREERVREEPLDPALGEEIRRQAEVCRDFLVGLLEKMDIEAEVTASTGRDGVELEIEADGDDGALLIGRHGLTLDALQLLTRAQSSRSGGPRLPISLEIAGYRARRRASLHHQAGRAAERARRTGRSIALAPMTPLERKVVHEAIAELGGVRSRSEGEALDRHVVIEWDQSHSNG